MLHLAIIGIVCAVSAPSEGTAFIGRQNNESGFCHSEEEQNVAKVSLPSYNVDVHNFSDCAKQKITNRTSSFFYEYIIKQYQDSKNSSCSNIKNAFLEKEKKPHSNVEFAFRKRNLLWIHHNSKFLTKTLRPVMEDENFQFKKPKDKKYGQKKCKAKILAKADGNLIKLHDKCNLNLEQKKMLLRLKKIKRRPEKEKLYPKHLDKIKVVDELDLNKRIEKLVKEVALENQQKEKYFGNDYDYAFIKSAERDKISDSSQEKEVKKSFFNSIKKLFCFHKNFFKNKKRGVDNIINSFLVNKVRGKNPIVKKVALIRSPDVSKTKKKTTRFKRNPYSLYNYFNNPVPIYRQYLIDAPYPYSANFLAKRYFLHPPGIRQVVLENDRIRPRPQNSLENWPFFKKFYFDKKNILDSRLKRYDMYTKKLTEPPTTNEKDSTTMSSFKDTQGAKKSTEKTCVCNTESTDAEKSSTKENEFGKTTEETILSPISSFEGLKESQIANATDLNVTQKDRKDVLPDHTLEKPFLERDFRNEKFEYFKPDPNFEAYESSYHNLMTDFPIFDLKHFQPNLKYKYELPDSKYLRPSRFLKVRHALRNHFYRNNFWSPFERSLSSFERKKRCGRKRCSMPRKCWRSAPLLCVPYIKKSQEDVLKYLIKVMQKMIGKPIPLKRDIFERTKFKPFLQKEVFSGCENMPEEEVYECECETTPVPQPFYSEYIDLCPPPQPPYYPDSKPFSCASCASSPSYPSCPPCALTSKLYAASPYPPYFSYPNSAKVSPESLKAFPYTNFNPPKLHQCPEFNSWPPEVSFYAAHMGQTEKQNSVHFEGKFATASLESTSSVLISTTTAASVTSGANISNSSQIVVSVPVHGNSSNLNEAKTSFLPFASDFNALPPQSSPTTVANPTASTDFEGVSPISSTRSACALYVSNSPVEQEERFSYTAIPYNGEPECATITNQNSETVSQIPSDQQPIIYNPVNSQKLNCDACFAKVQNISPNAQQTLEWPSTKNSLPTSEAFQYQSQIKETPKNYKELYESSPEYPLEYNQFRKDDSSQKFYSRKSTKEDLEKSLQYDEDLQNERQVNDLENPQKDFFNMKHKKVLKSKVKFQPPEFLPPYDYYVYDKYPVMRPNVNNNMKLGRYPIPPFFWKDFRRTMKTDYNSKSLIRRKREDYDFGSDNFDNYNEYFDDLNYNNEDSNELSGSNANCHAKNYLNSEGTPPSYEMLSELAKAITVFNDTESESTTPMSAAVTVNTFDSTDQLTKASSGKSSTNGVLNLEMTPNKTTDKVKNEDKKPLSQSNSKSSNLTKVLTSKTTFSSETNDMSFTQTSLTTVATDTKSPIKDRVIDSKKSGKTSFFQTNSKIIQTPKNSKKDAGKEEKESESNKDTKTEEEGQIPTTLKAAIIIKGQKKSMTKPSAKVYPKIYPDSFPSDVEINYTTLASTVTTVKALTENRTALLSSTSKPDIKLQLLAVCEGYLEIVKLIKNQNQTTEGDLDVDLVRYCENIISQSFNNQLEKPKKPELIEFLPQNTNKEGETAESFSENSGKLNSGLQTGYETARDFSESRLREKIIADILKDPVYTKKTGARRNETKKKTLNNNSNNNDENGDDDNDDDDDDDNNENDTNEDKGENDDNSITKKYEGEKTFSELERTDSTKMTEAGTKKEKDNHFLTKEFIRKQRKFRRKGKTEKGLSGKVLSKEEIKMLKILRKRKKALLSWLFNLKDQDKLDDLDKTEYFDDEDLVTETEASKNSGTIKPKRGEKKSGRTKKNLLFDNKSEFPIYAKRYGYDKGGELREVEVLWRKINEKTHEEKIFKNLSVLALYITSPNVNQENTKLVVNSGHENENMSKVDVENKNKIGCASVDLTDYNEKTTEFATETNSKTSQDISSSTPLTNASTKSLEKNLTHTFINKPDSSSIVGECPKVKKAQPNTTRKTSRKMEVAKDIFQEYTIEFVNYAVYILPIMLTIIFLFCCLCCALHILKTQQSLKSYRKKKRNKFLTPETSDTTEESGLRSKKKKREVKFKKRSKTPESDAVSEKIGRKKFWSVLKLSSKPSKKLKRENFQKGKKNTLLRFFKGAKKKGDDGSHRSDDRSETAERRELIALLEEVKKIEMDHVDDKKDLKSVQVQYMTQEDDSSVFQRPDVFYPYQKNVLENLKDYSFCTKPYTCEQTNPPTVDDCELYENVNELTELLPCECTYFSKKHSCLKHCDFNINQQDPCKRFSKIFRDSGKCINRPFNEKNLVKNESENRSFIFNKYRSISMDPSEELMGVTQKSAGTEFRLTDIVSPFALSSQKNAGMLKEIDNLKRQLISKKNVRLKDDGVLCRL